jgi:hypothetical protein
VNPVERRRFHRVVLACAIPVCVGAPAAAADHAAQNCPDVVAAEVRRSGEDVFDFGVTVSSPYNSARQHADAFCVSGPDGAVYGARRLLHDHAGA